MTHVGELPLDIPAGNRGASYIKQRLEQDTAKKAKGSKSHRHEDELARQFVSHQFPPHVRDLRFAKKDIGRQWRFDFAFPDWMIAVEVEGLVVRRIGGQMVSMGRHANVAGFREDCMKYAWAAVLGWTVLRFEQSQVKAGVAIEMVGRLLASKDWTRTHDAE